jgi:hypothetical protein
VALDLRHCEPPVPFTHQHGSGCPWTVGLKGCLCTHRFVWRSVLICLRDSPCGGLIG